MVADFLSKNCFGANFYQNSYSMQFHCPFGQSIPGKLEVVYDMNVIEFDPITITSDKRSQDYLRENFVVKPNKEKYVLTQTNNKYRTWSTITNDGEDTTATDDSTTDTF